jgi:hypothetical protein
MFLAGGYAHFANPSNIYQPFKMLTFNIRKIIFSLVIIFFIPACPHPNFYFVLVKKSEKKSLA